MWKFFGKTHEQRIEERILEHRLELAKRNRKHLEEETRRDRARQDPETAWKERERTEQDWKKAGKTVLDALHCLRR